MDFFSHPLHLDLVMPSICLCSLIHRLFFLSLSKAMSFGPTPRCVPGEVPDAFDSCDSSQQLDPDSSFYSNSAHSDIEVSQTSTSPARSFPSVSQTSYPSTTCTHLNREFDLIVAEALAAHLKITFEEEVGTPTQFLYSPAGYSPRG